MEKISTFRRTDLRIDCDACVEACPVDACFAEDQVPDEWAEFTARNAAYFAGR